MSETWANPGPDLLLELRGTRRRAGLEDALREAVRSGRLVPGTLLPSSRALAAELSLARNTVADAYGQLVAEGTPESVARVKKSHTGQYLARVLARGQAVHKPERPPARPATASRARAARA